jgi:hypothetical protein
MSDAEIRLPQWASLESMKQYIDVDSASSIEFQPERAGQRRLLFLIRDDSVAYKPTSHHERKMDANGGPIQYKPEHKSKQGSPFQQQKSSPSIIKGMPTEHQSKPLDSPQTSAPPSSVQPAQSTQPTEKQRVGRLKKDPYSNLPDTYRLESMHNEDLGLAAIRSLEISKQLREKCKNGASVLVDILWFEPFQKYEVKNVHS